jgi:hypothetical protein
MQAFCTLETKSQKLSRDAQLTVAELGVEDRPGHTPFPLSICRVRAARPGLSLSFLLSSLFLTGLCS